MIRTLLVCLALAGCGGQEVAGSAANLPPVPDENPTPYVLAPDDLPEYRVANRVNRVGGGTYGDVIIPAYRAPVSTELMSAVARAIVEREGFVEAAFYNTEEAMRSNVSESFKGAHPGALESGTLGSFRERGFYPTLFDQSVESLPSDAALPAFEVIERKVLDDVLNLSVTTAAMDQIDPVARSLIEQEGGQHYWVRVSFYEPGQQPGEGRPAHRIEWTAHQGFVQTF